MKEFLINHLETIFIMIGIGILIVIPYISSWFDGTKYEVILRWYIIITIFSSIAKWILK